MTETPEAQAEARARRFGGVRRLYGADGAERLFRAHVVVVGIGGVGSWAAEALARSGVRRLTLIDLDHVALSNVNRQAHALESTLGRSKVEAMRERLLDIHPALQVDAVDEFVAPDNWADLLASLGQRPDAVVEACDDLQAKLLVAAWAMAERVVGVGVGAAGGKRLAHGVEVADLSEVTHDPLLARMRQRLRKHHGATREGRMGWPCVFSREPVQAAQLCAAEGQGDGSLNCHGYGSLVSVTATFGFCAAGWVLDRLAAGDHAFLTRP